MNRHRAIAFLLSLLLLVAATASEAALKWPWKWPWQKDTARNVPEGWAFHYTQDDLARQHTLLSHTMLRLINTERARRGLRLLVFNPVLEEHAARHSKEMEEAKEISHDKFEERTMGIALRAMYYEENVARTKSVFEAHDMLMASNEHRQNILNPKTTDVGIGFAKGPGRTLYITQLFAERYLPLSPIEAAGTLLEMVQVLREEHGLMPSKELPELNDLAESYSKIMLEQDKVEAPPQEIFSKRYERVEAVVFTAGSLKRIPWEDETAPLLLDMIGAGAVYGATPTHPLGTYFVTVLLAKEAPRSTSLFRLGEDEGSAGDSNGFGGGAPPIFPGGGYHAPPGE